MTAIDERERGSRTTRIDLSDQALWATKVLRPGHAGAFRRDDARNLLRRTLAAYRVRYQMRIYAWALEPSRVHVVLMIPTDVALAKRMGDIFGYYTRRFNARYGKEGPIFRTKFLRNLLAGPLAIAEGIRRVHALAASEESVRRPDREPWSSAECYAGGRHDGVVTLYEPAQALLLRRAPLALDS